LAEVPNNTLKGNDSGTTANPQDLTGSEVKVMLALDNVNNTTDLLKPISTDTQTALDLKEDLTNKSTNIVADQASNTKYSSVKSIYDWATSFFIAKNTPITGATKTKITYDADGLVTTGADATTSDISEGSNLYHTTARARSAISAGTGISYDSGTGVISNTSSTLALGETSGTAYRGDRGKTAYDHSQIISGNPHNTAI
jgi:hypothetical protein